MINKRNQILKKPVLNVEDIKILFDCKDSVAYKQIEQINKWLEMNGKVPLVPNGVKNIRKKIRTVDYLDFCGLPHSLML